MLMLNLEERISIDDALKHRFIEKHFPQSISKKEETIVAVEVGQTSSIEITKEKLEI